MVLIKSIWVGWGSDLEPMTFRTAPCRRSVTEIRASSFIIWAQYIYLYIHNVRAFVFSFISITNINMSYRFNFLSLFDKNGFYNSSQKWLFDPSLFCGLASSSAGFTWDQTDKTLFRPKWWKTLFVYDRNHFSELP